MLIGFLFGENFHRTCGNLLSSNNYTYINLFVIISGYVSNAASYTGSFWGSNEGRPLATLITDDDNRILYPSPRVTSVSGNGWYDLPGYKGKSPKLVFSDFGVLYYFEKGRKLRVWYGEDWSGFTEVDNHGKSCMDVYFYLMGR